MHAYVRYGIGMKLSSMIYLYFMVATEIIISDDIEPYSVD
jgi:hypothetical protein